MATGSSGGSPSRGITKIRRRSPTTGKFTKQLITITLRSGRRVFSSRGRDMTIEQQRDAILKEYDAAFDVDFAKAVVVGVEMAINELINTFIPQVAMKTGQLRTTILNLAYLIRSRMEFEVSPQGRLAIVKWNWQDAVFSVLNYAIYHAVEFRNLDFYVDPNTGGTAPYSIILFNQFFTKVAFRETVNYLEKQGWDFTQHSPILLELARSEL